MSKLNHEKILAGPFTVERDAPMMFTTIIGDEDNFVVIGASSAATLTAFMTEELKMKKFNIEKTQLVAYIDTVQINGFDKALRAAKQDGRKVTVRIP